MKPTIITYPVPGNDTGGTLHIYGKPDGDTRNVILYCGGFPDGHEPFSQMAQMLASSSSESIGECYVGTICLPGYDFDTFSKYKFSGYRKEGYSFEDLTINIREAASRLLSEYYLHVEGVEICPRFTVIFHDWGVVPGLMFVNRSISQEDFLPSLPPSSPRRHVPDQVVLLDVLGGPHPRYKDTPSQSEVSYSLKPSLHEIVYSLTYRIALASAFASMRYISETLGVIIFGVLFQILSFIKLTPTRDIDNTLVDKRKIDLYHLVYMCYPYFRLFQDMLSGVGFPHFSLPFDLSKVPVLYLYGAEKNVMFHDWRGLAIMEQEEKEERSPSRAVKVKDAGHWLYIQKPDLCLDEIRKFVKECSKMKEEEEKKQEKDTTASKL